MNRYSLAAFAILAIALIVYLVSDPPPPARKRVRVAGKPQATGEPNFEFVQERKRGS